MKIILEGDGYGDSCIPEPCKNKEWLAEQICIYANAVKYSFIPWICAKHKLKKKEAQ